jgi:hypothetical protein
VGIESGRQAHSLPQLPYQAGSGPSVEAGELAQVLPFLRGGYLGEREKGKALLPMRQDQKAQVWIRPEQKGMSVVACSHCRRDYFSYPGSMVPPGYCSWPCWELRAKKRDGEDYERLAPAEIRLLIAAHRMRMHPDEPDTWHVDCKECQRLEGRLLDSLAEAV